MEKNPFSFSFGRASPTRPKTPLIPPSSFTSKKTSTPGSTSRFAPVFDHTSNRGGRNPEQRNFATEPLCPTDNFRQRRDVQSVHNLPAQVRPSIKQTAIKPEPLKIPSTRRRTHEVQTTSLLCEPPVYARVPRISTFSGSAAKGDVRFEDWRFEVRCLMHDNAVHEDLLLQSVRNSLKGEANRVAMHLGEHATLEDIMLKLERVYGTVESGTTLLQQFYNCRQDENESIGAYGCRLEDVLNKAITRGALASAQSDEMLRSKLWSGLNDERVRSATRYKLEQIHSFDELIGELRAAEQEIRELEGVRGHKARTQKVMYTPLTKGSPNNEELTKKSVEELTEKVKNLESVVSKQQETNKLLGKILDRIDALEKSSNYKGPLTRDGQKSQQQQQQHR